MELELRSFFFTHWHVSGVDLSFASAFYYSARSAFILCNLQIAVKYLQESLRIFGWEPGLQEIHTSIKRSNRIYHNLAHHFRILVEISGGNWKI